jgi:signal transduction histidine kinase/CheY-like chemotaxis protein
MRASRLTRTLLFLLASVLPGTSAEWAQQNASPRRVLVLHWYDKDFPANARFNEVFQSALQALDPGIEYYSEYWETNRFPGERQALLLRDYLRQKYKGRKIDALVAPASIPLDFLLKYRSEIFPDASVVFATERPVNPKLMAASKATGVVYANSYRRTIDLALKLHPGTKQVFIISGSPVEGNGGSPADRESFESIARDELKNFEASVAIHYLTDVPPEQLVERTRNLPQRSIIFYRWQQAWDSQGKLLESPEILSMVAATASAPIYGMSAANIGRGIVGGYVWTFETMLGRLAQITLHVADGARTADIPVERAPELPIFDWRQLQRWNIDENRLPRGSFVEFRQLTLWQQYKWRIIAALAVFLLQALLIGSLLMQRRSARRTRMELEQHKDHLENVVNNRTAQLVQARDQAESANRAKSAFLANMSHELRTPLSAILASSDLLSESNPTPDQREDIGRICRSGEHLLGLIEDVLDVAKIEAGKEELAIAASDLISTVRTVVEMMRGHAEDKHLALVYYQAPEVPRYVRVDAPKLRQILINLLGNAIKFTKQGTVTLRVSAQPADEPGRARLCFDIEDSGVGMPQQDLGRIFEPFERVSNPGPRKGTGLGLTITRRFVELMGGTLLVESEVGRGSRFVVELPLELARESETYGVELASGLPFILEAGQPEWRVLIVEDDPESATVLQKMLTRAGFQLRVAENGALGIEAFQQWRPHFIWMDLDLPQLGGTEATRRIRQLDGGAEIKIAAITAAANASEHDGMRRAGFDDIAFKPFRHTEIFFCMARHLGVRYSSSEGVGK